MEKEKCEKIVNEISSELRKLKKTGYYVYPHDISPYTINGVLDTMKGSKMANINILEDVNGCDMDWSLIDDFIFENKKYHVYGCVASGSLVFQHI